MNEAVYGVKNKADRENMHNSRDCFFAHACIMLPEIVDAYYENTKGRWNFLKYRGRGEMGV